VVVFSHSDALLRLAELLAPAYRILTIAAERRALAEDAG
jgi:hypothetical protein